MQKYPIEAHVLLSKDREGEVKYFGPLEGESDDWYGLELTDGASLGDNGGDWNGEQIFECEEGRGLFVREADIRRLMRSKDFVKPKRRERLSMRSVHDIVSASTTALSPSLTAAKTMSFTALLEIEPEADLVVATASSGKRVRTPRTPSKVVAALDSYSYDELCGIAPFDLIGRGVAGIEEMVELLDDSQVFFAVFQVEIGSGQFARYKNIFLHFNGESHPKPLQRAKANKTLPFAKDLVGHCHAPLTLTSRSQVTVEYIFNQLRGIFVADDIKSHKGKAKVTDINSVKLQYKVRMEEAKKRAAKRQAELERAEEMMIEEARLKRETEAEARRQAMVAEAEARRKAREDEIRKQKEAELAEKRRLQEEARLKYESEQRAAAEKAAAKAEAEEKEAAAATGDSGASKKGKKKKKRRLKRVKKDDWSDAREWTTKRVVRAVHSTSSPFNWVILEPSKTALKAVKWGHGDVSTIRPHLEPDRVLYGLYRLTFGSGKFGRSHWVFFCWTPDTILTTGATMKERSKNNKRRMLHVSWRPEMERLCKPWGVAITAESMDQVNVDTWILRIQKTVVVDGDELSKAAFLGALKEEEELFTRLAAEQSAKARAIIDEAKVADAATAKAKREEALTARFESKEVFARKQLSSLGVMAEQSVADESKVESTRPDDDTPLPGEDLEEDDEEEVVLKPAILDEEIPDHVDVEDVQLSEEEIAQMEEERRIREEIERKRMEKVEALEKKAIMSKLVLESIEMVKRVSEDLCWALFKPRL